MRHHYVIAAFGSAGDIFPFIELGKMLLAQDRDVSFITTPWFENLVRKSGMKYIPFGTWAQAQELAKDRGVWNVWNPRKGFNVFWEKGVRPNLQSIRSYIQSIDANHNVVAICHPILLPLADLARADRRNLKLVLIYLSPASIRTAHGSLTHVLIPPSLSAAMRLRKLPRPIVKLVIKAVDSLFYDNVAPDLTEARIPLGLSPVRQFFPYLQTTADLYVTLYPEWFSPNQPDYPKPLINGDFPLHTSNGVIPPRLTEFLKQGSPPIIFTAGTGNLHAKKFFHTSARVLVDVNARGVFLTRERAQLPAKLPENLLWQDFAPLDKILPSASAIVHHGGIGTCAEAIRAGVPQIIVPFGFDQFDNARIIQDLGLGNSSPAQFLTDAKLRRTILSVWRSEQIRANCAKAASTFRSHAGMAGVLPKIMAAVEDDSAVTTVPMASVMHSRSSEEEAASVLNELSAIGVTVSLEHGNVRCQGAKGLITAELRQRITRAKPAIIAMLHGKTEPPPALPAEVAPPHASNGAVHSKHTTGFEPDTVSVLLTTGGPGPILEAALRHLAAQDFRRPWELLLCDNGSDCDLSSLARRIIQRSDVAVHHVWNPPDGDQPAKCLNLGLKWAQGRIVVLLSGDMVVRPDFLHRHVRHHRDRALAVYGTRRWLFLGDSPRGLPDDTTLRTLLTDSEDVPSFAERATQRDAAAKGNAWTACHAWNFSFARDSEIFFDEALGCGLEDADFAVRLMTAYGLPLVFDESLFGVHIDKGGATEFRLAAASRHEDILKLIKNVILFQRKHPNLDPVNSCALLAAYELRQDGIWQRAQASRHMTREHLLELVAQAETSLERAGHLTSSRTAAAASA